MTCGSSANDSLTVAVGAEEQPRGIRCPATLRFRTAVGRTLILNIDLSGGAGRYVGQVRFSAEPFASDPTTTAQCHALSGAFSDIASAQNGYPNGPLDLSGWQDLMVSVGGKLKAVDDSGEIGTQLPALVDWYGRSDPTPANPSDAAVAASGIVHQLCLDNGTPLVIASQFGG